jgi:ABC-type glycerol-3-phosphate transport system permease component
MLRPTLATVAILNFIGYWNELLYAGLLLNSLPVIILFFMFKQHLVKGLSAGAIK